METIISLKKLILHHHDMGISKSLNENGNAKKLKFNTTFAETKFITLIDTLNLNFLDPYCLITLMAKTSLSN